MVFTRPRKNLTTTPCLRSIPKASLAAEEPEVVKKALGMPVPAPPDLLSPLLPSNPPWRYSPFAASDQAATCQVRALGLLPLTPISSHVVACGTGSGGTQGFRTTSADHGLSHFIQITASPASKNNSVHSASTPNSEQPSLLKLLGRNPGPCSICSDLQMSTACTSLQRHGSAEV